MSSLYHYTNTIGKNAIEKSGKIRQSGNDPRRDDAIYGKGVYFTSIHPSSSTTEILGNNWDGKVIPEWMKAKTEYYFEFNSGSINAESVGDKDNRDIYLVRDSDVKIAGKAGRRAI